MGTTSSGSTRSSAGCRYSAGISLYIAHTRAVEGQVLVSLEKYFVRRAAGVPGSRLFHDLIVQPPKTNRAFNRYGSGQEAF